MTLADKVESLNKEAADIAKLFATQTQTSDDGDKGQNENLLNDFEEGEEDLFA